MAEEIKKEETVQPSAQPKINAKIIIPIVNSNIEKPIVEGADLSVGMVAEALRMAQAVVGNTKYQ